MRERFPGSRLVVVADGHDHGVAVDGGPCVEEALADYLRDGTLPADGGAAGGGPAAADRLCPAPPAPEPEPAAGSETDADTPSRDPQTAPRPLVL